MSFLTVNGFLLSRQPIQ